MSDKTTERLRQNTKKRLGQIKKCVSGNGSDILGKVGRHNFNLEKSNFYAF